MKVIVKGHNCIYHVQCVIQIFFPFEKFQFCDDVSDEGITILTQYAQGMITSKIFIDKIEQHVNKEIVEDDIRYTAKRSMYNMLSKYLKKESKWGMLTGIRPAKKVRQYIEGGMSYKDICNIMDKNFFVSKEKIDLSIKVAKKEIEILNNCIEDSVSVYIGIPFCPSKCSYCSFTSYNINKYQREDMIDLYIEKIGEELKWINENIKKKVETIYIGGGTPTSINSVNLEKLLQYVKKYLDTENVKEYTIEAGRPDTLNREKLEIIKKYNITRISINPQTMNDITLNLIGRKHSTDDFVEKYNIARQLGFNNINVDLIFGLPKETMRDIKDTMVKILQLAPENITIHTLAIKTGSNFKDTGQSLHLTNDIDEMLGHANKTLIENNYEPYYMYRQKNMIGNNENIGYTKKGYECIYNIEIMEEKQWIMAVGVGATSKFLDNKTKQIERVFNFKSIEEYMKRFDKQQKRKMDALDKFNV